MTGNNSWHDTVINVTQEGSHSYSGQVYVFKYGNGFGLGKKYPTSNSREGDWVVGDTIKLSHCAAGRYIYTCIERSTCLSIYISFSI